MERRPDDTLVLDENYIPPCLDCGSPRLSGFIKEIEGLLHHRGEAPPASQAPEKGSGGRLSAAAAGKTVSAPVCSSGQRRDASPGAILHGGAAAGGELATFTSIINGHRPFPSIITNSCRRRLIRLSLSCAAH